MGRAVLTSVLVVVMTASTYLAMHFWAEPYLAVDVPPLSGLSVEQARGLLEPRGLLLVLDGERVDDSVPAGTLSEQHPLGGSRLPRGDKVHAWVARPSGLRRVPKLSGVTVDAARSQLTDAHLTVGRIVSAAADTVPKGLVSTTDPPPDTELKPDTPVDIVVSSGPATQQVPSVVGKRLSSAKDLLQKAGFVVGATKYGSNDDFDQGVVISQNPPANAQASPGIKIDLTIND